MKKILLLVSYFVSQLLCGQEIKSNLTVINPLLINPSVAGSSNKEMSAMLQYQYQGLLSGYEGAAFFTFQGKAGSSPLGYGLQAVQNKLIGSSELGLSGNVAYRLETGSSTLSLGLRAGYVNYSLSSNLEQAAGDDAFASSSSYSITTGGGVYWYQEDVFHVGLSAVSLPVSVSQKRLYSPETSFFLHGDYCIEINSDIIARPMAIVSYIGKDFLSYTHESCLFSC